MNPAQHDEFWRLYERDARRPLQAACRAAARRLSDNAIDPDDLAAWIDTRIWRMLERGAWPTFHDDPSPAAAVGRIIDNAPTLARWAYLGVCRAHWRQEARQREYLAGMSRAERLASVSAVPVDMERTEALKADLAKVRAALGDSLKAKIAASWPDKGERRQIAHALGADRPEDQALIEAATSGEIKENTVQQMRSRARKTLADIFQAATPCLLVAAVALALGAAASPAIASEQSGGRKGGMSAERSAQPGLIGADEQSGGRGGGRGG